MLIKSLKLKIIAFSAASVLVLGGLGVNVLAAPYGQEDFELDYTISDPYETVDWNSFDQYKADFHAHSRNSDGKNLTFEMVEDHYEKGYDILAMTDHNYTTKGWENADKGAMTEERKAEIQAGVGRDGRGMLDLSYANEQSRTDHINTFQVDWNNEFGATMADTLFQAESRGGFSHINHMGRYTGFRKGIDVSNDPANIQKYVDLLRAYPSTVGMEIINKLDNESRWDRILWDNILMELMPEGRNVWGFANDDTHSVHATGYAFNMMLMPELTIEATRDSMESGTFYSVSRISRVDGINATYPDGTDMAGSGNSGTLYMLEQSTPSISNIEVDQDENSIVIEGADYDVVEWIADGEVIATGNFIDLNDYQDQVNSYVRAQLKSDTGIAFTQPFGVTEETEEIELAQVKVKNRQAAIDFEIASANGKGYQVYLSETGAEGDYELYSDVNFNSRGAHLRNLENGREVHVYIVYVEDGVVTERSETVSLVPGK